MEETIVEIDKKKLETEYIELGLTHYFPSGMIKIDNICKDERLQSLHMDINVWTCIDIPHDIIKISTNESCLNTVKDLVIIKLEKLIEELRSRPGMVEDALFINKVK